MKSFSITRDSIIFSIRSDTFWLKNLANTNLKTILEVDFYPGTCKVNRLWRNLEYSNSLTQNKNKFPAPVRNLLDNISVNIKLSNESFP